MLLDRCSVLAALSLLFLGCSGSESSAPKETQQNVGTGSQLVRADSLANVSVETWGFRRISPYDKIVRKYARRWGFDWRLISAQIFVESGFREGVQSYVGAQGLMQIMPSTAKWLGKDPKLLIRPEDNIALGCYYDRKLYGVWKEREGGNRLAFMLASYNAGLGNVRKARRRATDPNTWEGIRPYLPRETRAYVPRIFKKYEEYKTVLP